MQKEIPLFQKVYDFYKLYYEYSDHFPKKSRPVLAHKTEKTILELLEIISKASHSSKNKTEYLLEASNKVDLLKVLFRLCYELKIIDQKKYFILEEKLQEIGRMVGGWLRSSKK